MKKILLGLILVLSISLVGCTYNVKDNKSYKEGLEYFKLDDVKSSNYSNELFEEISILDGSKKLELFKNNEKDKFDDFKYGILDSTIKSLKNKKEKGIDEILIKNETDEIALDELSKKQKNLYSDDYDKIFDEYIVLFDEIYKNYNGDNIDKNYKSKLSKINKKYDNLIDKIVEQVKDEFIKSIQDKLPKQYTLKGSIKFD